jgi:N utilization substance protein A
MQRFDTETIRLMTLFENITGVPVKDCINDTDTNTVYFIVEEGKIGMAIGKNGNSVKHAEKIIGKTIKIFEFSNELSHFAKHLIPQAVEVKVTNENNKKIVEIKVEKKDRALVIGRDGKKLNLFKQLMQRTHGINDLIIR